MKKLLHFISALLFIQFVFTVCRKPKTEWIKEDSDSQLINQAKTSFENDIPNSEQISAIFGSIFLQRKVLWNNAYTIQLSIGKAVVVPCKPVLLPQ